MGLSKRGREEGRPTECNDESIRMFCDAIMAGLTLKGACRAIGLSYQAVFEKPFGGKPGGWYYLNKEPYLTFKAAYENARAERIDSLRSNHLTADEIKSRLADIATGAAAAYEVPGDVIASIEAIEAAGLSHCIGGWTVGEHTQTLRKESGLTALQVLGKYAELDISRHELTGKGGGPIRTEAVSTAEAERIAREIHDKLAATRTNS